LTLCSARLKPCPDENTGAKPLPLLPLSAA
jgi:hypothetical protein